MKYFVDKEVECKCGCGYLVDNVVLFRMIDDARQLYGKPINPTSWCRCKDHNKKIGGSPTSSHLMGDAIDIPFKSWSDLGDMIHAMSKSGFRRILIYPKSKFVHVDISIDKPKLIKIMEQE